MSVFGDFLVRIQSVRKIRTRKTPNMDSFHVVTVGLQIRKYPENYFIQTVQFLSKSICQVRCTHISGEYCREEVTKSS